MTEESRDGGANPDVVNPPNKAFAAQRHRISELERQLAEAQAKLDDKESGGDPNTAALLRQIRSLETRLDTISLQGVSEEQLEEVMAEYPWIRDIPDKGKRIQAAKQLASQRAETNAGDPQNNGRARSEAAAQAHLTGGGPPAAGVSNRSDYDRDFAKYQTDMKAAKTQKERNALVDAWSEKYPDDRPI